MVLHYRQSSYKSCLVLLLGQYGGNDFLIAGDRILLGTFTVIVIVTYNYYLKRLYSKLSTIMLAT